MSDEEEQAEEVEDLAATADLSFDDIRRVLNKPEKQVRPAAATRDSRRPSGAKCRRRRCAAVCRLHAASCSRAPLAHGTNADGTCLSFVLAPTVRACSPPGGDDPGRELALAAQKLAHPQHQALAVPQNPNLHQKGHQALRRCAAMRSMCVLREIGK